jgi:hypothetical protein
MHVDSDNNVINFKTGKGFGLVDVGQRVLEGNTTIGRDGKPLGQSFPPST